MNPRYRPLTPSDAQFRSSLARSIAEEAVQQVRAFERDEQAERRREAVQCRSCFYLGGTMAGQAMSAWACGLCAEEHIHNNTNTPRLCTSCAQIHSLCSRCGGDLEMRVGRTCWPEPVPPKEEV